MQNQDGNATLSLIDPSTQTVSAPLTYGSGYQYGPNSGRGFDDVAFKGNKVFLSETNPAVVGDAVIVQLDNGNAPFGKLVTTPILRFGDTGTNLLTGAVNQALPVSDPDSLKTLADGTLVLTSGNDASLTFIHDAGLASQTESFITIPGGSGLDDAVMPTSSSGTFIVANGGANDVLRVTVTGLNTHDIYASLGSANAIVQIDTTTGVITPVVTGLSSPHGLAFLPSSTAAAGATSLSVHLDAAAASIAASYAAAATPAAAGPAGGTTNTTPAGGFVITHESPMTVPALTGHASHA